MNFHGYCLMFVHISRQCSRAMACTLSTNTMVTSANPFVVGDVWLDGEVIVFEDGMPTWWALQCQKWRHYFHIPDDPPLDAQPHGATRKRTADEAGLEMN